MRLLTQGAALARLRPVVANVPLSSLSGYGRTAAYRRISSVTASSSQSQTQYLTPSPLTSTSPLSTLLRSPLSAQSVLFRASASSSRHFHSQNRLLQQSKPQPETKENPAEAEWAAKADSAKNATGEPEGPGAKKAEAEGEESAGESKSEKKEGEQEEGDPKEKEEKAPPPPHGDKTPWQVFTETLSSEFKASKEWNDSTKQLSAGYQEFTENPTLRKARERYSAASDVAASTTGAALKKTAGAIGQTAAWTWDTTAVKGIRKGATVVGSGIEKVTRPVRETEAFKSVKETIDDGSSSRYGGWTEREERKRRREAREAAEMARTGRNPAEPLEENPEYVIYLLSIETILIAPTAPAQT
jgi:import inner membrane translocase subunit TIM44